MGRFGAKNQAILCSLLVMTAGSYLDNLRGVVLPDLVRDVGGASYARSSLFLVGGQFAAVATAVFLFSYLARPNGARRVVYAVLGMASLLVFLANFATSFASVFCLAMLLGVCICSAGTVSNFLALSNAEHTNMSRIMAGVHVTYGLGSILAPLTMMSGDAVSWRQILWLPIPLLAVAAFFLRRLPLPVASPQRGDFWPLSKGLIIGLLALSAYVIGEVLTSTWLTSYLVQSQNLSVAAAAPYVAGFFFCMIVTRLLCSFFLRQAYEVKVTMSCLILGIGAFLVGRAGFLWGFSCVGVVGPFFPVLCGRLGRMFPRDVSQVTGAVVIASQMALAFSHFGLGSAFDAYGAEVAFYSPPVMLGLSAVLCGWFFLESSPPAPKVRPGG